MIYFLSGGLGLLVTLYNLYRASREYDHVRRNDRSDAMAWLIVVSHVRNQIAMAVVLVILLVSRYLNGPNPFDWHDVGDWLRITLYAVLVINSIAEARSYRAGDRL